MVDIYDEFVNACMDNNLNKIKKLYRYKKLDIRYDDDTGFLVACENGNNDIAKWLYETSNKKININMDLTAFLGLLSLKKEMQLSIFAEERFLLNWKSMTELFSISTKLLK